MWEFSDGGESIPWQPVDAPVDASFRDATTTAGGPCAVGTGGTVLARAPDGTWGVIVDDGPGARGNSLAAVDVTDDGERIWIAGANGAFGCYDVGSGTRLDRSYPRNVAASFGSLAVAGSRGEEKLLVGDDDGRVVPGSVSGTRPDWNPPTRPAGDTAVTAVAATPDGIGFAVDANAGVYRTTATQGWRRIGLDRAEGSLYAAAASADRLLVGGDNGRVFVAPTDDPTWTPHRLGDLTVRAIDVLAGEAVAAGTDGRIFSHEGSWVADDWDGSATINGVALGEVAVAVGNDGLILERGE